MNKDYIKSEIAKKIIELTEEFKDQIHSTKIVFADDDTKVTIEIEI